MTTAIRQTARLRKQLQAEIDALSAELEARTGERDEAEDRFRQMRSTARCLEKELDEERLKRVSAQRGLVHYMRQAGLADRIGYDPDADPKVQAEIKAGAVPAKYDPVEEAASETIATKAVA